LNRKTTFSERRSDGEDIDFSGFTYDFKLEALPEAPIYHPHLQEALRNTKAQLRQLHSAMKGCPLSSNSDSTMSILTAQNQKLSEFDYPKTRTIGLVGDSGVGKKFRVTRETIADKYKAKVV
jgi:hypothetical protein